VLKYFLSFRIFEQLELALKTAFALNLSSRGTAAPPLASYATVKRYLKSSDLRSSQIVTVTELVATTF